MSNVHKLPNTPNTPRELIDAHADAIDKAAAVTMVLRGPDGVLKILWTHQALSQLLFASSALDHDVRRACFEGYDSD